ncbi:MAG: EF-P beta-lysylation protein EpmB [Planctomycetaceae bacterium]|nr:EF-P beta-lysylation protein EpmB [Planctomycetaceae bacterium]
MAIVASNPNPVRATSNVRPRWQEAMKEAIRDPGELCRRLDLPDDLQTAAERAVSDFPLFVTPDYLAKIELGNPRDPLLRQVLPIADELDERESFTRDPVSDSAAHQQPGLIHKYRGRALLMVTGACPIHCRYCFRRHFPYDEAPQSLEAWQPALQHIAEDASIDEVILSGGDPLTVVDSQLAKLVAALAEIPHLRRLRVHSRLPIVIPERVTNELLDLLTRSRLTPVIVVHANHPRELEGSVARSLSRLVDAGIPTLNQSVLLRGVNDDASVLAELSRRIVDLRVMPYYLHQLDRVSGAAHFEVPVERGRELIAELRKLLPGYAVPRYVQDNGGPAKQILT